MKNIIIKIALLIFFVSVGIVADNLKAMDFITEEETSLYTPRLMFSNAASDSSELIPQRNSDLSDEWDELYNAVIRKQKEIIDSMISEDEVHDLASPFSRQALLKESIKNLDFPTRKEVKAFIRTFPHNFNPETADLQKVMGGKIIEASSGAWKLITFLYGNHITNRIEGHSLVGLVGDKWEKHCYEMDYKLAGREESWAVFLTFARRND